MDVSIEKTWGEQLHNEFNQPYFKSLIEFVELEYSTNPDSVFPKKEEIFRAFEACPFDQVKVVILGQDPYPTKNHAHGLCFSVASEVKPLPRSLNNIYKELKGDLGVEIQTSGDLNHWAEQGVLLLNTVLTVKEGEADSHSGKGWEVFTDAVIQQLNLKKSNVVYLLWGSKAQRKAECVDSKNNLILSSPHPSPLSAHRGFFGCKHFSLANEYLKGHGMKTIEW